MSFAGARSVDARRRRRLATTVESPKRSRAIRRVDAAHAEAGRSSFTSGSPVLTWMPRARWPLAVMTVLNAIAAVALAVGSVWGETQPRWRSSLGMHSGIAVPIATAVLLLLSAQLCGIIFWYRKRSRRDFNGRYQRWLTAAAALATATLVFGSGLHRGLGLLLSDRLPAAAWNTPTSCWLVPTATVVLFLGPSVLREMLAGGSGAVLLGAAAILAAALAALEMIGSVLITPGERAAVTAVGSFCVCWLLFHSLWWHARHVVRVCNEPPRAGQLRAKLRRAMPVRRVAAAKDAAVVASAEDEAVVEEPNAPKRRRGRKPASDADAMSADADATEETEEPEIGRPGLFRRVGGAIAWPVTAPIAAAGRGGESWSARRATKAAEREERRRLKQEKKEAAKKEKQEQAELKKLAAEEKREAAAAAKRAAAEAAAAKKQGRLDQKAAAKQAKQQAADERTAAKRASAEQAKASVESALQTEAEQQHSPQEPSGSKRRQGRKQKNRSRQPVEQPAEQEWNDEWSDEASEDNRRTGRKERKKRRRNAA